MTGEQLSAKGRRALHEVPPWLLRGSATAGCTPGIGRRLSAKTDVLGTDLPRGRPRRGVPARWAAHRGGRCGWTWPQPGQASDRTSWSPVGRSPRTWPRAGWPSRSPEIADVWALTPLDRELGGCARQRAGRQRRRARGTNGEWQIRHDRRWLTVAVRDGNSAAPARLHEGAVHGLDVVDELSVGWRCYLLPEGPRSSGCARHHARAADRSAAGGGTAIGRRRRSRPGRNARWARWRWKASGISFLASPPSL